MTFFPNHESAHDIAETNAEDAFDDADNWTYVVERRGQRYVVVVCDEDGERLGYL